MAKQKMHIMAIGAHVGDMELTCGMLLAKHALNGDRITTVSLTAGERGAPAQYSVSEFRAMQVASAEKFARKLGGDAVVFDYRDGELPEDDKIKFEVCDLIRERKPDLIITHWKNSMHKDHATCHRVVTDGHFFAALATMQRDLAPHWAKGPLYTQNWEDSESFSPYIYIDVEDGFDLWKEAVQYLWLSTHSSFQYLDYYDALTRANGILIDRKRAEAFGVCRDKIRIVADSAAELNV